MRRRAAILFLVLPLVLPFDLAAQSGVPLQGHFVWGGEVSAFRPCGMPDYFWATMSTRELRESVVSAYDQFAAEPYDSVYLVTRGWISTGPPGAFEESYNQTWLVTKVDSIRSAGAGDCIGISEPPWLESTKGVRVRRRSLLATVP